MKIGIVGLPNVGKSTLFNALTKTYAADAANFPFCTIDPNIGRVNVRDDRLDRLAQIAKSEHVVPAAVEFVDIAGLVEGASKGEGRGNAFLANIREVDAIVQVVRDFHDADVHHVAGSVDGARDLEIINTELILADLQTLERKLADTQKRARSADTDAKKRLSAYEKIHETLDTGKLARETDLSEEERLSAKDLHLLTMKPFLYAVNVEESRLDEGIAALRDRIGVTRPDTPVLAVSAKLEADMLDFSDDERTEYLADIGLSESPTDVLIRTAFSTLGLTYFFTAGEKEARAWTIRRGIRAAEAAGVIHTDFEKKFIKAEVVSVADFLACGGWIGAREAGKVRLEWRDGVLGDEDVVYFKIGS